MPPPIVVGVEDSFRAQDAIALAGDLARPAGAEVIAVSAFPFDERPSEHYNRALLDPMREAAELTLERLCDPIADLPVRRVAIPDPAPARALLRVAADTDAGLLVVGSSHGRFTGQVAAGSTGRRLLQGAPLPVALAPQGHRMRPHLTWGRVTVGFDGSPDALRAVLAASALATASGRGLRVVRVCPPEAPAPPWLNVAPGYLRVMPTARWAAEDELARIVRALPDTEGALIEGDPATELARESELADMLVLGPRNYGPPGCVSLGDVGERLAEHAACPLVYLPQGLAAPLASLFGSYGKVLTGSAA